MNDILLAVTTFEQLHITKKFIKAYELLKNEYTLIFFDDCSKDGTVEYLKNNNYTVITKQKGLGLTDSYNKAYKIFIDNNYDYLFLLNNDILIPNGALENMITCLKDTSMVVPLTSRYGAGHNYMNQDIRLFYKNMKLNENIAEQYQRVQEYIDKEYLVSKYPLYKSLNNRYNGFAYGISKHIKDCAYSKHCLFNPSLINVGQEEDLIIRLKKHQKYPAVCLNSFFFHYKGVTCFSVPIARKNQTLRDNLNLYRK